MNKALTVYKASAGSGKTFTLAVEYISLLIKNPEDYQHILAVTFTNKATQEMKTRILSQLYGIANGLESSESYLREVQSRTGLMEQVIRSNARLALSLLIHRYSDFRIQTIDAFFQFVLRNMARELNLTANLRVDLNDSQVEHKAVDQLIDGLEQGQDILRWIRDYIDRNIEDDLGWNVIGKIKDFGQNIFKDFYKEHERQLDALFANDSFFDNYTKELRGMQSTLKKKLNDSASAIIDEIKHAGVDEPGLFRRFLYGYLVKQSKAEPLPDSTPGYVQTCIEQPDKWTSGKCPAAEKATITALASEKLCAMLANLDEYRQSAACNYQSAKLVLAHLSQLRLLHAIADTMNRINRESNRFMLSNTQSLLRNIIGTSDTPFIFEKIGTRLKHIMIDEFQDTSLAQWSNFRTLLENCMAQTGSRNLIVGDVKQSIYRWRQGDWQLLGNIDRKISPEYLDIRPLDKNFRSEENIVLFNNAFFSRAISATETMLRNEGSKQADELAQAYSDLVQQPVRKGRKGSVRITLLPENPATYREQILSQLVETVDELLSKGHQQNDIAILVRSKSVIQDIVETFLQQLGGKANIVSDEAFRLDASLAVTVIISALSLLVNPDDNLTRAKLVKLYRQQVLAEPVTDNELLLTDNNQRTHLDKLLPEKFTHEQAKLIGLPIIDLIDRLIAIFNLDRLEGQSAYICTFYDTLAEYLRDNPADINEFLYKWDETLYSKTIQSDEIEGIRLITIHASKGLEYPNVIIPFCDWKLEPSDTIWCPAHQKPHPFNALPIVPVDFSAKKMQGTVFESDYQEEHFQKTLDNLNLLYVAFTRTTQNLIISGKRASKITTTHQNRSRIIEQILPDIAQQLPEAKLIAPESPQEPIEFQLGQLTHAPAPIIPTTSAPQNPFTAPIKTQLIYIQTFPQAATFRQSNRSRQFVEADPDAPENQYIKVGNVLHQIFADIRTEADINPHLNQLQQEGIIYNDDITPAQLTTRISKALQNPVVKNWFSSKWQLFNECTILQYDPTLGRTVQHRPDRVMTDGKQHIIVDFKFGAPHPSHALQVRRYMNLLAEMGNTNIKGYLWYVIRDEIQEISLPSDETPE